MIAGTPGLTADRGPATAFDRPEKKEMARAVARGDKALIEQLVGSGAVDLLAVGRDATSWLVIAIATRQRGSLETLLRLGALGDPKGGIAGQALYSATVLDDLWWLERLHQAGADLNNHGGGDLLLVHALDTRTPGALPYYLDNGADVNMPTNTGGSVALSAAEAWRFDMANRFLDLGASPWVMDRTGLTLGFSAEDTATVPAWDRKSRMETERRRLLERLHRIGFPAPAPNPHEGRRLRDAGQWPPTNR